MVELGILEYAQINEGCSPKQALAETLALAKYSEANGFKRFWVAEHHNVPAFASSSPELIMMHLLDQTERIRIGSGGVMLPHYSPLKVAENFRVLEALHPGRVDLGIGNTSGTRAVNNALNERKTVRFNYEEAIKDLQGYLTSLPDDHRHKGVVANPNINETPQMWVLSSSVKSARMAAKLGLGYAFGIFPYASKDRMEVGKEAVRVYRETFEPSAFLKEPKVTVAPFLTVAEDTDEALAYADALDLWLLGKDNFAEFDQFPSVQTAQNYIYTDTEKKIVERNRTRMVTGDIREVTSQLEEISAIMMADELLLIPLMPSFEARKEAVRILADHFLK